MHSIARQKLHITLYNRGIHSTTRNSYGDLLSYHRDKHHSLDVVHRRRGGAQYTTRTLRWKGVYCKADNDFLLAVVVC